MAHIIGIRFLFVFVAFSLPFQFCSAQRNEKVTPPADSIKLETPEISVNNDCNFGYPSLSISFDEDTNYRISQAYLYKKKENFLPTDTLKDTLTLIRKIGIEELAKQGYKIFANAEGDFAIKLIHNSSGKIESDFSSFVSISQCSELIFKNDLDKQKEKYFSPSKLVNIQIKEFNIFDRVGETVYTHRNNDIAWEGTYLNGQKCPNGIYYFYCEYIDIAKNGEKKTLSGMIELKNN